MKINTNQQLQTGFKMKKAGSDRGAEVSKDQVSLGQGSDNLGIMEKPLGNIKSVDGAGGFVAVAVGAFAAGGALLAGIGMAGKAIGGLPGAVVAVGLTGVAGGLFAARNNDKLYYQSDKTKNTLRGAAIAGGIATAGAVLGGHTALGALGAGALLGAGTLFVPNVTGL